MIGQKDLLKRIDELAEAELYPRFSIFVGPEGSGKTTLATLFANKHWKLVEVLPDVKVDTIRKMIEDAYSVREPIVYIIRNAESMSVNARNSLLKVTEEPPNKATFIMTTSNGGMMMDTIVSRATIFYMRPYKREELEEYLDSAGKSLDAEDKTYLLDVFTNVSEMKSMLQIDIGAFRDYADKLMNSLSRVTTGNALKTKNKVNLSEKDNEYDLVLLWKACLYVLQRKLYSSLSEAGKAKLNADLILETSNRLNDLGVKGANKEKIYDLWVLNIRKRVEEYEASGR